MPSARDAVPAGSDMFSLHTFFFSLKASTNSELGLGCGARRCSAGATEIEFFMSSGGNDDHQLSLDAVNSGKTKQTIDV